MDAEEARSLMTPTSMTRHRVSLKCHENALKKNDMSCVTVPPVTAVEPPLGGFKTACHGPAMTAEKRGKDGEKAMALVTLDRLESTDHYRLQVNADRDLVAFCYNAMVGFLSRETMAVIRNQMASVMSEAIAHQFRVLVVSTPGFRDYLQRYLRLHIAEELRPRALALWRTLGFPS